MNDYKMCESLEKMRLSSSSSTIKRDAEYIKNQLLLRRRLLQSKDNIGVKNVDKNLIELKQKFNSTYRETYERYIKRK